MALERVLISVMAASREDGANPKAVARKWVDEHADQVAEWLDGS